MALEITRTPFKWFGINPKYSVRPSSEDAIIEANRRRGVFQFHWNLKLRLSDEKKAEIINKLTAICKLQDRLDRYVDTI